MGIYCLWSDLTWNRELDYHTDMVKESTIWLLWVGGAKYNGNITVKWVIKNFLSRVTEVEWVIRIGPFH